MRRPLAVDGGRSDRYLICLCFGVLAIGAPGQSASSTFRRGDVNEDRKQDLSDAVRILGRLFLGDAPFVCEDSADVNDDGRIDLSDPVALLNHLFLGAAPPPPPYPDAGADPTPDLLSCSECGGGLPRPVAIACAAGACSVSEDVLIESTPRFRNDAPAVVLDAQGVPHVLSSVAEGGYFGFHATPGTDGKWRNLPMQAGAGRPVALATADLALGPEGALAALVNSGDLTTSLWTYDLESQAAADASTWTYLGPVPGLEGGRSGGLAATSAGCLAAAGVHSPGDGSAAPVIAEWRGKWTVTPVPGEGGSSILGGAVAIGPDGTTASAYWSADAVRGWVIRWNVGTFDAEDVIPLGSNGLERQTIGLELTGSGPDLRAHLLAALPTEEPRGGFELVYLTRRRGDAESSKVVLATEEPQPQCPGEAEDGAVCDYEYTAYRAHMVVADSAGRPLVLYSRVRVKAHLTAICGGIDPPPPEAATPPGPPPPLCRWEGTTEMTGELIAATFSGEKVETEVIVPDLNAFSLDAALGSDGALHIAAYELDPTTYGTTVRYLRVSAP